jgi:FKBP-type peptidyl-prolyl cis-trans isomerase SlyD
MKKMYIAVSYDLFCGEPEELMERATENQPFTFYSGVGMALERFENEMLATELNGTFDFTIPAEEAYGEYDDEAVITLEKEIFMVDGKIDEELSVEGNVLPLLDSEGNRFNGSVVKSDEKTVTVDLNHPLAGENLHFVGKILIKREASDEEIANAMAPSCSGCGGGCSSEGNCSSCGCDCSCE